MSSELKQRALELLLLVLAVLALASAPARGAGESAPVTQGVVSAMR